MSEEILQAILRLLAIVAKEDDVTSDERASIENFLRESLDDASTKKFLSFFDHLIVTSKSSAHEQRNIREICSQINQEQTAQQKIVIILNLTLLIAADGVISDREDELLSQIGENLHISQELITLVKAFVIYQERSKVVSSNILIIDNGSHEIPSKCKHLVNEGLEGFIFFLRIPELEVYFAKCVGERGLLLNEFPMRSNRIYNFSSGSVIRLAGTDPIYHSDVVNVFRQVASEHHITFTARHITFKFKNGTVGLRNINIEEEGGKLIALMGGSGSGKSTLLNVLNGNETPADGSVRINGVDIHINRKKIEGVIGYVPQDDLLMEDLNVFDNLFYAAKLCFRSYTDQQLKDLVNKTLESLGLYEIRNLKVGSPLEKTISGGQRKRLNIGLELLREPSVLFVDEPTSGLSSRDSENIMDLMKELSLRGKMIFVVIHQPSEDIFKMFDKLIILDVGGYQIYYGNPVEAIAYFKGIVKMVDQSTAVNPEQIFNIIETKVVNEFGNFTNQRKITPYEWYRHYKEKTRIKKIRETDVVPHKTLDIPGKLRQLGIFMIRDIKSKFSNRQYLTINILEAPLLAFLLAFIIRYQPEDSDIYRFKENMNIPVFFFMSVIVALFMGLTVSAEEIIRDRRILKREAFLNLSRLSYLLSKLLILFSLSAIQTLLFVVVGELILEIKGMTATLWLVLFSVSCFANVLGLNVSSTFKSAITVYILIPLLIIPQLILSGVVVKFDKLNPYITTKDKVPLIGEIMASRWAYEALAVSQFKNNAYERLFYPSDKVMAESEFKTVYLFPRLESDLKYIHHRIDGPTLEDSVEIQHKLATIRNELNKELSELGRDKFPDIDKLYFETFSNPVFESTIEFIKRLRAYYNLRFKKANEEKQVLLKDLTATEEDREAFRKLRENHENEAIGILVKNMTTEHRILEHDHELVRKIYPIYHDPEHPEHPLDFRAQFYQPSKHFAGRWIDTLVFNVAVIWTMTILLFTALYFDWLKKIVNGFSRR